VTLWGPTASVLTGAETAVAEAPRATGDPLVEPSMKATVLASSFAATLELVREGHLELNQHAAFAPLYVRKRQKTEDGGVAAETGNG